MILRQYNENDLEQMIAIWNEVVEEGIAFPQEEPLDAASGREFFASQSYCGVAVVGSEDETADESVGSGSEEGAAQVSDDDSAQDGGDQTAGQIVGLYILHPNNVGRCGHICNASYAVNSACRGQHIGEKLVLDCLDNAKRLGFGVLQFNAVVETNIHARHLYERLGFVQLGTIPKGFRMKDGHYENICPYYHEL